MKCACICPGDDLHPCLHDLGEGLLWERGLCSGGGLFGGCSAATWGDCTCWGSQCPSSSRTRALPASLRSSVHANLRGPGKDYAKARAEMLSAQHPKKTRLQPACAKAGGPWLTQAHPFCLRDSVKFCVYNHVGVNRHEYVQDTRIR